MASVETARLREMFIRALVFGAWMFCMGVLVGFGLRGLVAQ